MVYEDCTLFLVSTLCTAEFICKCSWLFTMKYINPLVQYAADSNLQGCIRKVVIGHWHWSVFGISSTALHVTDLQSLVPKG